MNVSYYLQKDYENEPRLCRQGKQSQSFDFAQDRSFDPAQDETKPISNDRSLP